MRISEYAHNFNIDPMLDSQSIEILSRIDLYCGDNGSDKVYIMLLIRHKSMSDGDLEVLCYYGRRGNRLSLSRKNFMSEFAARDFMNKKQEEKQRKAYTLENIDDYSSYHSLTGKLPTLLSVPEPEVHYLTWGELRLEGAKIGPVDLAMEHLPDGEFMQLKFERKNWHSWEMSGDYFQELPRFGQEQQVVLIDAKFMAIKKLDNTYCIYDILEIDEKSLVDTPWYKRRAMLTYSFKTAHPTLDPFDSILPIHLSNYTTEDFDTFVNEGPRGLYLFRDIQEGFLDRFNVLSK